jgi:hypothetical protein
MSLQTSHLQKIKKENYHPEKTIVAISQLVFQLTF